MIYLIQCEYQNEFSSPDVHSYTTTEKAAKGAIDKLNIQAKNRGLSQNIQYFYEPLEEFKEQ